MGLTKTVNVKGISANYHRLKKEFVINEEGKGSFVRFYIQTLSSKEHRETLETEDDIKRNTLDERGITVHKIQLERRNELVTNAKEGEEFFGKSEFEFPSFGGAINIYDWCFSYLKECVPEFEGAVDDI